MQKTYKSWLKEYHEKNMMDENVYLVCNHIISNIRNDNQTQNIKPSDFIRLHDFYQFVSKRPKLLSILTYDIIFETPQDNNETSSIVFKNQPISNRPSLKQRQRINKQFHKTQKRMKQKEKISKQSAFEKYLDRNVLNNSQILSLFNFIWSQTLIWCFYASIMLLETCANFDKYGLTMLFTKVSLLALGTNTLGFILASKRKNHPTIRSMINGWSEMFYFFFTMLCIVVSVFACVIVGKLIFNTEAIQTIQQEIKPYIYILIALFGISRMYFNVDYDGK